MALPLLAARMNSREAARSSLWLFAIRYPKIASMAAPAAQTKARATDWCCRMYAATTTQTAPTASTLSKVAELNGRASGSEPMWRIEARMKK